MGANRKQGQKAEWERRKRNLGRAVLGCQLRTCLLVLFILPARNPRAQPFVPHPPRDGSGSLLLGFGTRRRSDTHLLRKRSIDLEHRLNISVEFILGLWTEDPSSKLQETRWRGKGIKGETLEMLEMGRGSEKVA